VNTECPFAAKDPISFAQPDVQRNPMPLVRKLLAADAPITLDPITGFYVAARWQDIDYIYSRPDLFSSRSDFIFWRPDSPLWKEMERHYRERGYLPMHTLVTADPPDHTVHRKLVDRVFTVGAVRNLVPRMTEIADALIDSMIVDGKADLFPRYAVEIPLTMIAEQMGVPKSDRRLLKRWGDVSLERLNPNVTPERELEIVDELIAMQQYIVSRAEALRQAPDGTLFSAMVHSEIDGARIEPRVLVNLMHQLLVGGHETTTSAIASAIFLMLSDPDLHARLAADHTLIPNFVEEALRQHPPVLAGYRVVLKDTEVGGVLLPKGAMLFAGHVCANFDEAKFTDPDVIDPQRRHIRQHMTFGRGIHYCIGNVLARSEISVALERLLTRAPKLHLDPNVPPPQWKLAFHTHVLDSLNVVF
jgi:cytochrome P450